MSNGKSILIVDDHTGIRKMLRWRLELDGFLVSEAADGAEGVEKSRREQPDLVVLDLAMPGIDGLQTARTLKRTLPHIPLLMFTENSALNFEQVAWNAGISAFVDKSHGFDHLVSQANLLLGLPAATTLES
jgi:DNA-binding response OmpR family regulator